MASTRRRTTKDGRDFYEIRVSRGRGKAYLTSRWYVPDGWSQKAIDRELARQAADFERRVKAGEVISREERKERELQERREAERMPTVRQYAEKVFMPTVAIRNAENTRNNYQRDLDNWVIPTLGDLKMQDITASNISALLLYMQEQGKSHRTVLNVYAVLRRMFGTAYREDTIEKNPMDKVDRPAAREDEAPKEESEKSLTEDELNYVLSCVAREPLKWQAYIHTMADTGLRRGECTGLHWADINFQTGEITVRHNLQYTPMMGVFDKRPKNKKVRTVYVGEETLELLRQLRKEQAASCISKWCFTRAGSAEPIDPATPTKHFKKFGERYGVGDFHPHKLRHTYASLAITNGADVVSVSENLGHYDPSVTLKMYSHANEESKKRASEIFRNALKAKKERQA